MIAPLVGDGVPPPHLAISPAARITGSVGVISGWGVAVTVVVELGETVNVGVDDGMRVSVAVASTVGEVASVRVGLVVGVGVSVWVGVAPCIELAVMINCGA